VFVKINGERLYLWRAVDHEGEILESCDTKKCAAKPSPAPAEKGGWC
jgi:transposase-like protein